MKTNRIFGVLVAALVFNMMGCGESVESIERCSTVIPCANADQVCINGYCVDRCRPGSCLPGYYCDTDGLCKVTVSNEPSTPGVTGCSLANPCPTGYFCNAASKCEAVVSPTICANDAGCRAGLICENYVCVAAQCDATNPCVNGVCNGGRCESTEQPKGCLLDTECGIGMVCENFVCSPAECDTVHPCANGVCQAGRCVAVTPPDNSCRNDSECGMGMICEGSVCVAAECDSTHPCATGTCQSGRCVAVTPPDNSCRNDSECGMGMICEGSVCVAAECDSTHPCATGTCQSGRCVTVTPPDNSCSGDANCGVGLICESSVCVPAECDSAHPCVDGVCQAGRCVVETPPENSCVEDLDCGAGLICEEAVCVPAECSASVPCVASDRYCRSGRCEVQLCGNDDGCDANSYCHIAKCIKADPCQNGVCDGNLVCSEKNVCIPHCKTFACPGDMVCPADGLCIDPCTSTSCGSGEVCNPYGFCVDRCTPETCPGDGVTCGDDGLCHEPECSSEKKCTISYQVCDNYQCVDKCKSNADCSSDKACQTTTGLCIPKCTVSSCEAGDVCTSEGLCVRGTCSDLVPCGLGMVCNAKYECVESVNWSSECYFDKPCLDPEVTCKANNKPCADANKQCNAYNKCILKSEADGLGLGELCGESNESKKCASDLACVLDASTKVYVCREGSILLNKQACNAALFEDRCEGNMIIECNEDTGRVEVQNCKTSYSDWTVPSTGKFYGEDFYCAKRIDANYVTCVQKCANEGDEKFICGWDPDYTDVDYSDRYVCQINSEGYKGYFPADTEVCRSWCEYETGKCE